MPNSNLGPLDAFLVDMLRARLSPDKRAPRAKEARSASREIPSVEPVPPVH